MIRAATSDDLASVRQIAEHAFEPFVDVIGKKPAPMVANFAQQIEEGVVVVAEEYNAILGYCVAYQQGAVWHVENLAVASSTQGHGVGARLMADSERRALAAKCSSVELYTNVAMDAALAFYPRLGYAEIYRGEEDGFKRAYFRKALA